MSGVVPAMNKALVVAALVLFAGRPAVAAPSTDALAEELVTLRAEVEALGEELELERAAQREELVGLAQRRAELEGEARREELRLRRTEAALSALRASATEAGEEEQAFAPVVLAAAEELRAYVRRGIPFRVEERLAAIDDVTAALERGELAPAKAAQRLWALHQDEARLVSESGMYRQAIELEGETVLADVARVGMVLLYFKAPGGVVGRARRDEGGWRYERLSDESDVRRVEQLFDAFERQLRTGFFELPVALGDIGDIGAAADGNSEVAP